MYDVQTLLKAYLNMSLRSACFIDESILVKVKTSGHGTTFFKCQIIRISILLDIRVKKLSCMKCMDTMGIDFIHCYSFHSC